MSAPFEADQPGHYRSSPNSQLTDYRLTQQSTRGKGVVEGAGIGLIRPPGHERHIEGV
jgi:hypothetical protein